MNHSYHNQGSGMNMVGMLVTPHQRSKTEDISPRKCFRAKRRMGDKKYIDLPKNIQGIFHCHRVCIQSLQQRILSSSDERRIRFAAVFPAYIPGILVLMGQNTWYSSNRILCK